jgi:hypothetical protein
MAAARSKDSQNPPFSLIRTLLIWPAHGFAAHGQTRVGQTTFAQIQVGAGAVQLSGLPTIEIAIGSFGYDRQRTAMWPAGGRTRELTGNSQPSYIAGPEAGGLGTLISGGLFTASR